MNDNLKHHLDADFAILEVPSAEKTGTIRIKNPSACWLPDLAFNREIGGTVYSVFGSYEGSETLDKKLLRIMAQNAENREDSE